jgi:hypothetical protein
MRGLSPLIAIAATFALAGAALAAPASATKLRAFAEGGTVVSINDGTVTIDNRVIDGSVTYDDGVNPPIAYNDGGVYLGSKSQSAKPLDEVVFGFVSSGKVTGGAPRISWPIDTNRNGKVDGYAFIDVAGCGSSTVSSTSLTCTTYFGSETFPNWAAFAAAHPSYRSAPGAVPFIIADGYGGTPDAIYIVSNIVLR